LYHRQAVGRDRPVISGIVFDLKSGGRRVDARKFIAELPSHRPRLSEADMAGI